MRRKTRTLPLLLALFLLTVGCRPAAGPATPAPPASTPVPVTPTPTPEPDPVEEALSAMTTEEKVGQLLMAGFYGAQAGEEVRAYSQDLHVGGVILFGRNVESAGQLVELTNGLKALAGDGIPLLIAADQEGGSVDRMPPEVHRLPNPYDAAGPAALGRALGAECAAFGIKTDFAPSLDVWSNPDNTVIGRRAFGSDPETAAEGGTACAAALMEAGVIAVGKHFPGHGDTGADSHTDLPVVDKTREALLAEELVPFQTAILAGLPAVMMGHILMTQIDPERPASLSPAVVTGLLREELGFDGVVVTDDLTMGAVTQNYGLGEAAVLAVEAGCDLLLVCHEAGSVEEVCQALLAAAESGRLSQARLDQSVRRLLALKLDFGVNAEPVEPPDLEALNALVDAVG